MSRARRSWVVDVPELVAEQQPGAEGGGASQAGMDVPSEAAEVLHAAVGLDAYRVAWVRPGLQEVLPLGQVLRRADHDVEQLDRGEAVGRSIGSRDDVTVPR